MAEIDTFDSLFFLFWKNICLFYERWGRSMSIIVLHHLFLRTGQVISWTLFRRHHAAESIHKNS